MALAQLTDLKQYIGKSDTTDDALLNRLLSGASDFFESQCGRTIATASFTEVRNGDGRQSIAPRHYPVVGATSVAVDGNTYPQATGSTDPGWVVADGLIWLRPMQTPASYPYGYLPSTVPTAFFNEGRANVMLVYTAGYDPIPQDVQQAVIELAALKYRDRQHIGKSGESLAGASVTYLPSLVPASVQSVIESYRRYPSFS